MIEVSEDSSHAGLKITGGLIYISNALSGSSFRLGLLSWWCRQLASFGSYADGVPVVPDPWLAWIAPPFDAAMPLHNHHEKHQLRAATAGLCDGVWS
jgi:hypothetical protein